MELEILEKIWIDTELKQHENAHCKSNARLWNHYNRDGSAGYYADNTLYSFLRSSLIAGLDMGTRSLSLCVLKGTGTKTGLLITLAE